MQWGGACVVVGGGVHRIRPDTVNERLVRILLECILVIFDLASLAKLGDWLGNSDAQSSVFFLCF